MKQNTNWVVKPSETKVRIKEKDRELIDIIYSNARLPLKEVGKKLNLSKVAVFNRIKNLEEKGIISGYSCFIDFNKLGFNTYQIGIKTNMTLDQKEKYILKMQKDKFVNQIAKLASGRWDFLIRIISNEEQFNTHFDSLADNHIERIDVLQLYKGYFSRGEDKKIEFIEKANISFDKQDINLLLELAKDSRQRIVDLATKLKLSTKTVINRIKELQKKKVILSFPTKFNPFIYGTEGHILLITTKTREIQENLSITLSKLNSTGVLTNFQNPNIFSFHIVSSLDDIKKIEGALKPFMDDIKNYEFVKIEEQSLYDFFPKGIYEALRW